MPDGPTAFIVDPVANFTLAHYFSEKCYRRPWMGPLDLQLLMPLTLTGPIISLRRSAVSAGWAHYFSETCSKLAPICRQRPDNLSAVRPKHSVVSFALLTLIPFLPKATQLGNGGCQPHLP